MYGFSDQWKPMPLTRLSALRHGSSRYSTPTRRSIEHTFASLDDRSGPYTPRQVPLENDLPPSTGAPLDGARDLG